MKRCKTDIGEQIIASLEEAVADFRGEKIGVRTRIVHVPARVDVKAIRRRLHMSQSEFARTFGFPLGTVQNWERGHRQPEGAARAFLTVIAHRPDVVVEALRPKRAAV
jgi:putative transcriptional regulator